MKTLLLAVSICLPSLASQAQWVRQVGNTSSTVPINALDAVDENIVWAINLTDISRNPTYSSPGCFRTVNGGSTWITQPVRLSADEGLFGITGLSATTAFVTTRSTNAAHQRILRTLDGGTTWTPVLTFPTASPVTVKFFNATEGVAIAFQARVGFTAYLTNDGGTTWGTAINLPALSSSFEEPAKSFDYYNYAPLAIYLKASTVGNTIWFGTDAGRVYRSTTKGQSWQVATTGISFNGMAFRDALHGLVVRDDYHYPPVHSLSRTTDGGATWTLVTYQGPLHGASLGQIPGTTTFISVGAPLFNSDAGSSYSQDNGQSWIPIENTYTHLVVEAAGPTAVWTGAPGAIYKLTSTVLGTQPATTTSRGWNAFPSPSSTGQFTLQFAAGQYPATQLRVFNTLGSCVYSQAIPAAARPEIELDLAQQAPGLYIIQLETGNGVTKQSVLIN